MVQSTYTFTESDLAFLNNYKELISRKNVVSGLKRLFCIMLTFILETAIIIIWWLCLTMISFTLTTKLMCKEFLIVNYITCKIYYGTIYCVGKILNGICNIYPYHSRKKIIFDKSHSKPYLERYYVLLKNRTTFPFNVFLHKFINSDGNDIHDHPWGFFHLIISGGYWEYITVNEDDETLDQGVKKVWRAPGYHNIVTNEYKHRIALGFEKPWTLCIPFRKVSNWSFWVPVVWKKNGPCLDGSINDENHMKSTKWRNILHDIYLSKK